MPLFGKAKSAAPLSPDRLAEVERLGKEALLLEGRLNRPITKNDLFLELHIPFDLLDSVTSAVSKDARVDLRMLGSGEREALERESHDVIVRGLAQRAKVTEKRGLTLADVAALCPAERSLADLQRLFGYMRSVLELKDLPPRMLMPTEVTRLLARAAALPPEERTPFRLVAHLGVGLYTARLVKAAME